MRVLLQTTFCLYKRYLFKLILNFPYVIHVHGTTKSNQLLLNQLLLKIKSNQLILKSLPYPIPTSVRHPPPNKILQPKATAVTN